VSPGSIIVKPQVLQLRQNVVAFRHAIFLQKFTAARGWFPFNGVLQYDSTRSGSKGLKRKKSKN